MKSNYKRLGDCIQQVDVRNRDNSVERLLGVNLSKEFIPSVANTIGTDMSVYKVISYNQFGCKLMSVERDAKMPISLYKDNEPSLISSAYYVFEVIDENTVNPDYLFMWIKRPEFDRQLWFSSGGDVRGGTSWDNLCNMPILLPSIEVQRQIVAEYQAVERRIENNRRLIATLEDTAQTIYRQMFVDNINPNDLPQGWRMGTIGEFGEIITGKTPLSSCPEDFGDEMDFLTPGEFRNNDIFYATPSRKLSIKGSNKLKNKIIPIGGIVVTCIGSDMGKVRLCGRQCISNQQINSIIVKDKKTIPYIFFTLRTMKSELQRLAVGSSTMPMLSKSEFQQIPILIIPIELLSKFYDNSMQIIKYISSLDSEINILKQTLSILLTKFSRL